LPPTPITPTCEASSSTVANGAVSPLSRHPAVTLASLFDDEETAETDDEVLDNDDLQARSSTASSRTTIADAMNKRQRKTSKYIGVSYKKRDRKYQAEILFNGKRRSLGYFDNEIDAARAYDLALISAKLTDSKKMNFPDSHAPAQGSGAPMTSGSSCSI
jgi:hypothetical protein